MNKIKTQQFNTYQQDAQENEAIVGALKGIDGVNKWQWTGEMELPLQKLTGLDFRCLGHSTGIDEVITR